MSKFKLACANVRGINDIKKRYSMLEAMKDRDLDLAVITDARLNDRELERIRQSTIYDAILCENITRATTGRGLLIMWKRKSLVSVKKLAESAEGDYLLAEVTLADRKVTLCGIYG